MEDYSAFVPNVHFELIQIKNLVSNQEYQRNLSMRHVKKAVQNFDIRQVNPIKVSRRDGINYVFNGQHTIEIIAEAAESRDVPVWCMVYDGLDYVEEAQVFANQQKYVKTLTPYEIFKAQIEAGSDKQIIIRELVESFGLIVSDQTRPGTISAVSTIEEIYDKYGYSVLERTLGLSIATWESEYGSLGGSFLKGLAKLIYTYGNQLDDILFKDRLALHSPKEIIRTAKDRRGGYMGFAETFLIFYNKKVRSPLKWSLLYASAIDDYPEQSADEDPSSEEESAMEG